MSRAAVLTKRIPLAHNALLSQALWVVLFAGATAVGARFEIPHQPVPYTLQTFFVLLAGAFLGARNGALSQLLYLAIGALGAPVFALGGFGVMKLIGPTGGYLLAFPFAAALVGSLTQRFRSFGGVWLSMLAGLLLIFASGTFHLYAFFMHDLFAAVGSGFLLFSWWDLLKLTAAAAIYYEVVKRLSVGR